ncbi:MAG: N-acetyltransferase [Planctomycetes bacterium]|nr:N-acetyltransferase [Planctomycetota bacterium]
MDSQHLIGEPLELEAGVVLGHKPGRTPAEPRLLLGPGAKLRAGTIIYAGSRIGARLETGHYVIIREDNELGDDVKIWNNTTIDYGCRIGQRVKIHCNGYIAQFTVLEDDVFLAPGVSIANDPHPGCEFSKKCMRGPTIQAGAQIGAGVTILPFVTIGRRALVGAGSVVTKDVPAETVVAGNPARVIRSIYDLGCPVDLTDHPYKRSAA